MKVVFVYPAFEGLGIEYLSAALRMAGHETALVFDPVLFDDLFIRFPFLARAFSFEDRTIRRIVAEKPDLVAFSIVTNNLNWFLRIAKRLRQHLSVPIVAGGPHCTAVPDSVLETGLIDYVIVGEGEEALVELADSLSRGSLDLSIRNLCFRKPDGVVVQNPLRPPIADLDSLPWPDKSLYDETPLRSDGFYVTQASRGCPFRCSYCQNSQVSALYRGTGRFYRRRSVGSVIRELQAARKKYRFSGIYFADEIFVANQKWLREFVPRYKSEIGLPFICNVYPSMVKDETAALLAEGGCTKVDMGVQSLNDDVRRNVLLRHETNGQVANAIRALKRNGISVFAENIINLPGETEEHLLEMIRFYNHNRPDLVEVYWLSYFPKTRILDYAVETGVVLPEERELVERGLLGGSFAQGGSLPNPLTARIAQVFLFMLHLPPSWVDAIIERRLYRWLPNLNLSGNYLLFLKAMNLPDLRKNQTREMMPVMFQRRYFYYGLKKLAIPVRLDWLFPKRGRDCGGG